MVGDIAFLVPVAMGCLREPSKQFGKHVSFNFMVESVIVMSESNTFINSSLHMELF